MRKIKLRYIVIIIVLVFLSLKLYEYRELTFTQLLNNRGFTPNMLRVANGNNGVYKEITDSDIINDYVIYLNGFSYKKMFIQELKVGWSYGISLYNNDQRILSITFEGNEWVINGKRYYVSRSQSYNEQYEYTSQMLFNLVSDK